MPGVSATPMASYAEWKAYESFTTGLAVAPAFPARWFSTYCVLTPERPGFFVSVAPRVVDPQGLAPATGAPGLHTFADRACIACLAEQAASIAFHPAFVAIASRPSLGWNGRTIRSDLGMPSNDFLKNGISGQTGMLYPAVPPRQFRFSAHRESLPHGEIVARSFTLSMSGRETSLALHLSVIIARETRSKLTNLRL
jgi:hypothetical protein